MGKLLANLRRRTTQEHPVDNRTVLLRPPEKTWRQKAVDFFWDKRNRTCMTRSPVNWLAISVYYSLFVSGVMLIFYISMLIAEGVASRDTDRPQYVLDRSWIGTSPSLNFFPMRGSRSLIWLSENENFQRYVDKITEEFECYKKKSKRFNETEFGACSKAPFGYSQKTPCLFFRMNRILLWKPKPFTKYDHLPNNIPQSVKDKIASSETPKIWLTCRGTSAKDRDHMKDHFFNVQGDGGFDVSVYPFEMQDDFIDPIIAMQLKNIEPKRVLYSFTCSIWANKLDNDKSKVEVSYYIE